MAKKSTKSAEPLSPPNLIEPRDVACQKIQAQIEKGQTIRSSPIYSEEELDKARAERSKWSKYNTELLTRLFDNSSLADEYNRVYGGSIPVNPSIPTMIEGFHKDMDDRITRLEAMRDRLDLIPELPGIPPVLASSTKPVSLGQDIFVVHGHDEASREAVSRFIEKLDFRAVVLHEQPSAGRTIIEKFEAYANVGFAVILLTPDDVGSTRDKATEPQPRARQNVIFELGYFIGKLGRERVCALYKENVELPSDIHGILYISIDNAGAWRLSLAKEMKQAGLTVDLNKAL